MQEISEEQSEQLSKLLYSLLEVGRETECIEFKTNEDIEKIGEYISALANSAALMAVPHAYLVYGVNDKTHEIVGTGFKPSTTTHKGQELETWILTGLKPHVFFKFHEFIEDRTNQHVVILEINPAQTYPVRYRGEEFIRSGSNKVKLRDFPEKERELWKALDRTPFEAGIALENIDIKNLPMILDVTKYYELLEQVIPEDLSKVINDFKNEKFIIEDYRGVSITNLGAILFARNLDNFPLLKRKAVRLVFYEGQSKVKTIREFTGHKGYAAGFSGLIDYIQQNVTQEETYDKGIRKIMPVFPEIMIRESIANALIHQDLNIPGMSPIVEIFSNRIEISNPGKSLVDLFRLLDSPPQSRNENLASFMRRVHICEERGTGIDKIVTGSEMAQLPAPRFDEFNSSFKVTLFGPQKYKEMSIDDKVRACYLHCCLRYVNHDFMTNSTLRERFGLSKNNSASVSRLIKESMSRDVIKQYKEDVGTKAMKYIPYWA